MHDGDLWDTTESSDQWGADLYVSVHCNSSTDASAHGIETYALKIGGKAEKLAEIIQTKLVAATGLNDRGVKFANLHELRETNAPAVLVEMGFISSPAEELLMNSDAWDERVAVAIFNGICEFANILYSNLSPREEVKRIMDLILVGRGPDERAAGYLADYLQAPLAYLDAVKQTDIKTVQNIYIVGGNQQPVERAFLFSGKDRYETCQNVLDFIANGGR